MSGTAQRSRARLGARTPPRVAVATMPATLLGLGFRPALTRAVARLRTDSVAYGAEGLDFSLKPFPVPRTLPGSPARLLRAPPWPLLPAYLVGPGM